MVLKLLSNLLQTLLNPLVFDLGNHYEFTQIGLYTALLLINDCVVDHFEIERNHNLQFIPRVKEDTCLPSNWQDLCCDNQPPPEDKYYQPCKTSGELTCSCNDLIRGGCPACTGPEIIIATSKLTGRYSNEF